jgi:hypothetical protein
MGKGRRKKMKAITEDILMVGAIIAWLSGVVLASGCWSTFFAVVFPPYAWYLVVETAYKIWGII